MTDKEKLECIRSLRIIAERVKSSHMAMTDKHVVFEKILALLDEILCL